MFTGLYLALRDDDSPSLVILTGCVALNCGLPTDANDQWATDVAEEWASKTFAEELERRRNRWWRRLWQRLVREDR